MTVDYDTLAQRHGVSRGAVEHLAEALVRGNGQAAQFNHPDLGGMGQWMPTMIMIGDMFNAGLKAKVDALCRDIMRAYADDELPEATIKSTGFTMSAMPAMKAWWSGYMDEHPVMSGSQNDAHYAWFATAKRLLIQRDSQVLVYNTGDYRLTGVSQQQQTGSQRLHFHTAQGITVSEADFEKVAR